MQQVPLLLLSLPRVVHCLHLMAVRLVCCCRYELNYGQVAQQRDQVHAIALWMLYMCANCSPQPPVAMMLKTHCSVQVIQ